VSKFHILFLSSITITAILIISNYLYPYNTFYPILIILSLFITAIYFYGVFEPGNSLFVKTIKGKTFFDAEQGVLLRFDDGPDPIYTPQILDILKENNVQAMFAVTGENSLKHPDIVTRIYKENHLLANHSYSHSYLISLFSRKKLYNDIQKCNKIIEEITGQKVKYYCSPMGHKSLALRKVLIRLGMELLAWDIRSYDTQKSEDDIIKIICSKVKERHIILFHDGIFKWTKNDREATINALKEVIIQLNKRNLLKPLSVEKSYLY